MFNNLQELKRREEGFTLVELAVVMIIIGLLIGGVLKGQELIANAQVTSTVSQAKSIDAATTTFRDLFNAMPGDMPNGDTRLPDCANDCVVAGAGTGDGRIATAPGAAVGAEGQAFWLQLNAADLLTGINPTLTGAAGLTFGNHLPSAPIGGGWHIGFTQGSTAGDVPQLVGAATTVRGGHWLTLTSTPGAAVTTAATVVTPNQGFRIDSKMDDGVPNQGSVRAFSGTTSCAVGTNDAYNEAVPGTNCGMYIRVQQ